MSFEYKGACYLDAGSLLLETHQFRPRGQVNRWQRGPQPWTVSGKDDALTGKPRPAPACSAGGRVPLSCTVDSQSRVALIAETSLFFVFYSLRNFFFFCSGLVTCMESD